MITRRTRFTSEINRPNAKTAEVREGVTDDGQRLAILLHEGVHFLTGREYRDGTASVGLKGSLAHFHSSPSYDAMIGWLKEQAVEHVGPDHTVGEENE